MGGGGELAGVPVRKGADGPDLPAIRNVPVVRLPGVVPGVPGPGWVRGGTFRP